MRTLHEYFNEAGRQPRALSETGLQEFVAAHADDIGTPRKKVSWRYFLLWSAIGIGLIGTLLVLAPWKFESPEGNVKEGTKGEQGSNRPTVVEGHSCPLDEFVGFPHRERSDLAPASFAGLPMLELSIEELRRIGIEKNGEEGITLYHRDSRARNVSRDVFYASESGFPEPSHAIPEGITPLPFSPRLVTDDLGRLRRFWYTYDEIDAKLQDSIIQVQQKYSYLSDAGKVREAVDSMNKHPRFGYWFSELHRRSRSLIDFNRLLPVLIRSDRPYTPHDSLMGYCRPDVIVWFDPTPELVALLPSNWRERMSSATMQGKEMEQLSASEERRRERGSTGKNGVPGTSDIELDLDGEEKKSHTLDTVTRTTKSARITNPEPGAGEPVMRRSPGAILEATLSSNPVESIASLRLRLSESRVVAVSLHGIMGNRLGVMQGDRKLEAGKNSLQLLFDGIPSGIYLLAIGTDRGELEIVRVILK